MTNELLSPGPGNPARRLLRLVGGSRAALRYEYGVAALVAELRRDEDLTYAECAERLAADGVMSFRGKRYTAAYLGQIARTFPNAHRGMVEELIEEATREEPDD